MRQSFIVATCQALLVLAVSISAAGQTVTLSTASVSFGKQTVGTSSAAKAVTVTNTGSATLTFTSIVVAGADRLDFSPLFDPVQSMQQDFARGRKLRARARIYPAGSRG